MAEKFNREKLEAISQPRSEKSKMSAEMRMLRYELKKKDESIELLNLRIGEKNTKIFMLEDFLKSKEQMLADNNLTRYVITASAIGYVVIIILLCAAFYVFKL